MHNYQKVLADIYEQEYNYWPWGLVIKQVSDWIITNADKYSVIIDYMCGTGYLLNNIKNIRNDLDIYGCSITENYINYAKAKYKNINVQLMDVFDFKTPKAPNIIVCTGGIHHLKFHLQKEFIRKVASELSSGSFFLIGEELLRYYDNEKDRLNSVDLLHNQLLSYLDKKLAPDQIINAANNLREADKKLDGEFKISLNKLIYLLNESFVCSDIFKVWPLNAGGFGNYFIVCRKI